MSRNVNVVILCEDQQQEVFARRFLVCRGYNRRRFRVERNSDGRGSGEQYVRVRFPKELETYRERSHHVQQALVVVIDADRLGVPARLDQLERACDEAGMVRRREKERVPVFVPARNIETWLAYLEGKEVDEQTKYPKLERPRHCQRYVDRLYEMCQQRELRQPAPPSPEAACDEYRSRLLR